MPFAFAPLLSFDQGTKGAKGNGTQFAMEYKDEEQRERRKIERAPPSTKRSWISVQAIGPFPTALSPMKATGMGSLHVPT